MLFEFPPTSSGASLGVLNHNRLSEMRRIWGDHPLDHSQWKLFLIDNRYWFSGNVYNNYQLGWAMVYYLFKEHQDAYGEYLRKIFGREPDVRLTNTEIEKEFEDCFGKIDEEWIEDFYEFLDELAVKKSLLPPEL
jgi:hypothetical protein